MDWQFLHKYLRVKRAKLSSNKGELYTKEDLHTKVTNARNNLNIMVNYLVNQTNLIDSVQNTLQLAYSSDDFKKGQNNYVTLPCDARNIKDYYNKMLISDDIKDKLSFEKLENSYQKYIQYQFAVDVSKAFHRLGYKTAVDNLNLRGISQNHYPVVKIFL